MNDQVFRTYLADPKLITGISNENPGVVSVVGHGYANGDRVVITNVSGMTEVNNREFVVTRLSADTFSIGVDTTTYTPYTSGGTAQQTLKEKLLDMGEGVGARLVHVRESPMGRKGKVVSGLYQLGASVVPIAVPDWATTCRLNPMAVAVRWAFDEDPVAETSDSLGVGDTAQAEERNWISLSRGASSQLRLLSTSQPSYCRVAFFG